MSVGYLNRFNNLEALFLIHLCNHSETLLFRLHFKFCGFSVVKFIVFRLLTRQGVLNGTLPLILACKSKVLKTPPLYAAQKPLPIVVTNKQ